VIRGASSALADPTLQLDPGARVRLAESIADRAEDMSALVSNVLDLMRFESGGVPTNRTWESLDDLVGIALSRVESKLQGWPVEIDIPDALPPIHVDAALVTQVIANLLENAAKHTPEGTHVRVSARADGAFIEVAVEDDGPGLPPGDPERLFEKFQRGRDESDVPGAGLGLAICRAIVVAHGGRIAAGNRPAGGARFAFTLPLHEAPP
jgi:two-component system sensor histidine kinase KdpD